jgi:hypothetical protein
MKKFILVGGLTLIVLAAGFYINHRIKMSNLNEKLQSAIGKDQGITETILKIENESSSMSFSELFELCDKSVKERTDMLIDLRGLSPDLQSTLKDSLIEFLSEENELVRNKSQSYRKYLNVSTGSDRYDEILRDWRTSSYYMSDYYHKEIAEKLYELIKDAGDMKSNVQAFIDKFKILAKKEKSLADLMREEGLRFEPLFTKYQESNLKYMNNSMEYANLIINKMNKDKPTIQGWGYYN